jgi:hypothetical protein
MGLRIVDLAGTPAGRISDRAECRFPVMCDTRTLVPPADMERVVEAFLVVGGTVIRTSFDQAHERALREALAGHAATEQAARPAP